VSALRPKGGNGSCRIGLEDFSTDKFAVSAKSNSHISAKRITAEQRNRPGMRRLLVSMWPHRVGVGGRNVIPDWDSMRDRSGVGNAHTR